MKLSATKWSHRCEIQRQHACTGAVDLPIYYTPVTRAIFTVPLLHVPFLHQRATVSDVDCEGLARRA